MTKTSSSSLTKMSQSESAKCTAARHSQKTTMRGKELQAIRRKLGLTQVELAKALRVDSNAVARRERDERTITDAMA